jgi:hypothetical protein
MKLISLKREYVSSLKRSVSDIQCICILSFNPVYGNKMKFFVRNVSQVVPSVCLIESREVTYMNRCQAYEEFVTYDMTDHL